MYANIWQKKLEQISTRILKNLLPIYYGQFFTILHIETLTCFSEEAVGQDQINNEVTWWKHFISNWKTNLNWNLKELYLGFKGNHSCLPNQV